MFLMLHWSKQDLLHRTCYGTWLQWRLTRVLKQGTLVHMDCCKTVVADTLIATPTV
jgi:hypothetical protein